ncbi:MAG: hypothetical protein V1897_09105 [Pseudomonadota bacterium]
MLLRPIRSFVPVFFLSVCFAMISGFSFAAVYGIKDSKGIFTPKISVEMGNKQIVIYKKDPHEKFKSFALILNRKNAALIRNINQLNIEWIASDNRATKAVPFAGPTYDPVKLKFEEPVARSIGLKLVDRSSRNLFAGKQFSDLFSVYLDEQKLVVGEGGAEQEGPIKLGAGRDISINIDKTSITFNENNIKKGEIINIDNRSGLDQTLGLDIPEKDLLYTQIVRKPEQTKVPREIWPKFKVNADSGIFVVLIPDPEPSRLAGLNGKEVTIKIYQADKIRETIKIPIKTSGDSSISSTDSQTLQGIREQDTHLSSKPANSLAGAGTTEQTRTHSGAASVEKSSVGKDLEGQEGWTVIGIWLLQIFNLAGLIVLAVYLAFFMLPKLQVIEARMSKNEMFLLGAREAIREELDKTKEDVLKQCGVSETTKNPDES